MSDASKRKRAALPPKERAGLHIEQPQPVFYSYKGGTAVVGYIDVQNHIFQGGGELREIINLPKKLLSMPTQVFEDILMAGVVTIEMIDHDSNRSIRCNAITARAHGRKYNTKGGERFGIPLRYCAIYDKNGDLVERSSLIEKVEKDNSQTRMEI